MDGVPDDVQRLLGERAWLAALARQLVRRHEIADEAAHEALVAAWTRAAPARASPRRWLAAILKKQLAGRRRAEHRRAAREQQLATPDAVPPVADVVARFEVQRAVADAVLALPEPYRTAVLRRFWDDETPAAIAAAVAVPIETVRTRLKRGLAMLRERLDATHRGDRRAWALPLWLATRRTDSIATGLFLGVALMTSLQKLVAAGIAAGLAVLLWTASSPPESHDVASPPTAEPAVPAVGGVGVAAATAPLASERAEAPAAAPSAPGADPQFAVAGIVVDDESDAPLAGIGVRLVAWPRDEAAEPIATSDADGRFTLLAARVTPGACEVFVESPDYAFAHAAVVVRRDSEAPGAVRSDPVTLRLVRGTWLSGQVVDTAGAGVAGAQLLLPFDSTYYGGAFASNMLERFAVLGRAAAAGRFRLAHAVGPDEHHGNVLFAVAPSGIGWCSIAPSKQRSETSGLVVRMQPTGALRVVVRDAAGAPCPGVLVRALPRFAPLGIEIAVMRVEPSGAEPVSTFFRGATDANGVVRFPLLPVGEARMLRTAGTNECAYDLWLDAAGFPMQPLRRTQLRAGAELEVVVHLVASRRVAVGVVVRDDAGVPVPEADVEVIGEGTAAARTDAAGRAELTVDGALYTWVTATAAGHGKVSRSFDVGVDTTSIAADLVLPRVLPLDGVVEDQNGEPVPGVSLSCDGHSVDAITDARGAFHVAKFPRGEHTLTVAMPSGTESTHWTGKQQPEVVDASRGPARIVMDRRPGNADVRVAIVDARSGQPLEPTGAALRLFDPEHENFLELKQLHTALGLVTSAATPAGKWRLDVVTAAGHRGSLSFELDANQATAELRLPLQQPGTLTGRVRFAGGVTCERVTVHVQHARPDPQSVTKYTYPGRWVLDAASQSVREEPFWGTAELTIQPALNASFRLERVDPDQDLELHASGDGVEGKATVRVAAGGTADVVLELRHKAPAKGR